MKGCSRLCSPDGNFPYDWFYFAAKLVQMDYPVVFGCPREPERIAQEAGLMTDQLFRAVCKGVLDPLGLRNPAVPEENLLALLQLYKNKTPTEFLAYTRLNLLGTQQPSKTLLKKWSNKVLSSLEAFDSDRKRGDYSRPCDTRAGLGPCAQK